MARRGWGEQQSVHGLKHEADHMEDLDVQENTNIKIELKGTGQEVMGWINLAQDIDTWRSLVKEMINLHTSCKIS